MKAASMSKTFQTLAAWFLVAAMIWLLPGCESRPPRKAVCGTVTCAGEKADKGTVHFVPIRDTKGPPGTAYIIDGRYQLDQNGGIYPGTYRVEIMVQRKTAKKIPDKAFIGLTTDEWEPVSDLRYAGDRSPLQLEITSDSDVSYDYDVPRR
ncbi:MAG: hypothetical protein JXM70_28510 [Pirellulales bacterium]|nr:hypothetical protein [Pirellulales bacterium]